ncbi:MAG TPA: hypothetical protein VLM89_13800, partial [Phycisphaerae bacterium]|nr:hypothetical protein [Phycisphaerae bacterium]
MTKRLINLAATLVPVFCCCSTGPSAPPIQAAALASRPASAPASAPAVAASRRASPGIKVISVTPVKGPAFPDKLVRIEYTSP